MEFETDSHGATDVGRVRDANEDQYLIADLTKSMLIQQTSLSHDDGHRLYGGSRGHLYVVADGMGGHRAGDVASGVAVDTLASYFVAMIPWFLQAETDSVDELKDELARALQKCQAAVRARAKDKNQTGARRMGTTLTMAYLVSRELFVVHVGDSRCYMLRGSELHQLTTDHTVAQQMVERGIIEPEDAGKTPFRSSLSQVVGGDEAEIQPDVHRASVAPGDIILLCTDGLTREVSEADIAAILSDDDSAEEMCTKLIDAANQAGGTDNITVVVSRVLEEA